MVHRVILQEELNSFAGCPVNTFPQPGAGCRTYQFLLPERHKQGIVVSRVTWVKISVTVVLGSPPCSFY